MNDRMPRHALLLFLVTLAIVALLAACSPPESGGTAAPQDGSTPNANVVVGSISNYTSLSAALRDRGLSPFPAGAAGYPFMSIAGIKSKVGSEHIGVFEYRTDADADIDQAKIHADGTVEGETPEWKSVPHFYRSGRVIVIYDGTDAALLQTLSEVMGTPFAEGK